ncbi:MAG: starch-binding domain-like protein [Bacteroidetes bacterium]|nr:starch-binding domain-like protein [Bacteroidota bacterium]MDF2451210.1 starch-binding domain-like protein [Bacteroidota bacterium]
MKTLTKLVTSAVLLAGLITIIPGCKKDNPQGYMTVKMTDAPAEYKEVNVEIIGLSIHTATKGWLNVHVNKGIYNLLDLRNNVTVVLADKSILPVGKATQIRLQLGTHNSILVDEMPVELKVPSGEESGLKININETIENGQQNTIILDFDAKESIVEGTQGNYILKPVIRVKSSESVSVGPL